MCANPDRRDHPELLNEILVRREGGFFKLETRIFFPHSSSRIFAYFSDARNLEPITPPWLRFRILTPLPITMSRGTRILYRLRLHGIPIRWETEITDWEPPFRFVDMQRRGPYRLWIHQHLFEECSGGCRMTDTVRYSVWGGKLVNSLFVKKDVVRIFRYRAEILRKVFGTQSRTSSEPGPPVGDF